VETPPDPFADHPLPREPVVRCLCGSGLIYPTACSEEEGSAVIECRCPECERREVMVTSPLVAALWRHREARAADAMHRLADTLEEQR
jgi:hypothetical protein